MKKETIIKLGILMGLVSLFFLILFWKKRDEIDINGYTERCVSVEEVKERLFFYVYDEEEWDAFFEQYEEEYPTKEMQEGLLHKLGVAQYITLPSDAKENTISREQWNEVYEQVLGLLDINRVVEKKKILVLEVSEGEEETILYTNEGDFATGLHKAFFEKWTGWEIYSWNGRCIGVASGCEDPLTVENVYLHEVGKNKISFLYQGGDYSFDISKQEKDEFVKQVSQGVCDIVFQNQCLIKVSQKKEYVEGNMLSYTDDKIEIEGYGMISHDEKLPVYQVYGEVQEKSISDVVLGNMQLEYIVGGEEICAILICYPANIEDIRVLLLSDAGGKYRDEVYLVSDGEVKVTCGGGEATNLAAGTVISVANYAVDENTTLTISPTTDSSTIYLCDENGNKSTNGYFGSMELRKYAEGYTVVNTVEFETYLYAVVPSEMPSSYQTEALKAQAVCARSYAFRQLMKAELAAYGAHIDDSTSYQVYNKTAQTPESIAAVDATAGKVMTYQGEVVEAFYFSTSMGYTDTAAVWNAVDNPTYGYLKKVSLLKNGEERDLSSEEAFKEYIMNGCEGYDSGIKFFRWSIICDFSEETDAIKTYLGTKYSPESDNICYYGSDKISKKDSMDQFGKVKRIEVVERSKSGSILTLGIVFEKGYVTVKNEYNIRKVLGFGAVKATYADGSTNENITLFPSAVCTVEPLADGTYVMYGGGYGHGLGMSQNGANGLAKDGYNFEEILTYFYKDVLVEDMRIE